MIEANGGSKPGWLGLLREVVNNPSAHSAALLGFFMYLQFRLWVEVVQPLVNQVATLTEVVRQLERSIR